MRHLLDRVHATARRNPALSRLAILSRILLAVAFIPTGLVKLLGHRFTTIGTDSPVGSFFEAMYQTGCYWNFLGLGQVSAGVLLLLPATCTLGAVMFLPIILNITVVTWSIGFTGTIYVTPLMLLANVFLLCWDYDRLRHVLFAPSVRAASAPSMPVPRLERLGYLVLVVVGLVTLLAMRGLLPMSVVKWMLLLGCGAVMLVFAGWIQACRTAAGREQS